MRKKILEFLPEIELIKEREIREKVILTWLDAIEEGGWREEELKDIPFTLAIERVKVNLFQHTRAVTLTSLRIYEALSEVYEDLIPISRDFLLAGALLHDVGKLIEYKREKENFVKSERGKLLRHPVLGAMIAKRNGVPNEILHIIVAHSVEGEALKRTPEAIIVHHSDFVNFEQFK